MKPRILDLYCCEGGAAKGYADAGWEVVGVDIEPQPRYPFEFHWSDARDALHPWSAIWRLDRFDAIHASPPCQKFSKAQRIQGREHPDLIAPTRELLEATGLPYVIENVEDARDKLRDPVTLCGTMFGLAQYRHRLFETNWPLDPPLHGEHYLKQAKMGRAPADDEIIQAVGNFSGVARARRDLGVPWMSRDGIRECIPPAFTTFIGERLLAHIESEVAA